MDTCLTRMVESPNIYPDSGEHDPVATLEHHGSPNRPAQGAPLRSLSMNCSATITEANSLTTSGPRRHRRFSGNPFLTEQSDSLVQGTLGDTPTRTGTRRHSCFFPDEQNARHNDRSRELGNPSMSDAGLRLGEDPGSPTLWSSSECFSRRTTRAAGYHCTRQELTNVQPDNVYPGNQSLTSVEISGPQETVQEYPSLHESTPCLQWTAPESPSFLPRGPLVPNYTRDFYGPTASTRRTSFGRLSHRGGTTSHSHHDAFCSRQPLFAPGALRSRTAQGHSSPLVSLLSYPRYTESTVTSMANRSVYRNRLPSFPFSHSVRRNTADSSWVHATPSSTPALSVTRYTSSRYPTPLQRDALMFLSSRCGYDSSASVVARPCYLRSSYSGNIGLLNLSRRLGHPTPLFSRTAPSVRGSFHVPLIPPRTGLSLQNLRTATVVMPFEGPEEATCSAALRVNTSSDKKTALEEKNPEQDCREPQRSSTTNNLADNSESYTTPHGQNFVGLSNKSYNKGERGKAHSSRLPGQVDDSPNVGLVDTASQRTCAICYTEFYPGDPLRCIKRCRHRYHLLCIDRWFENNSTCPICRWNLHESFHRDELADSITSEMQATGSDRSFLSDDTSLHESSPSVRPAAPSPRNEALNVYSVEPTASLNQLDTATRCVTQQFGAPVESAITNANTSPGTNDQLSPSESSNENESGEVPSGSVSDTLPSRRARRRSPVTDGLTVRLSWLDLKPKRRRTNRRPCPLSRIDEESQTELQPLSIRQENEPGIPQACCSNDSGFLSTDGSPCERFDIAAGTNEGVEGCCSSPTLSASQQSSVPELPCDDDEPPLHSSRDGRSRKSGEYQTLGATTGERQIMKQHEDVVTNALGFRVAVPPLSSSSRQMPSCGCLGRRSWALWIQRKKRDRVRQRSSAGFVTTTPPHRPPPTLVPDDAFSDEKPAAAPYSRQASCKSTSISASLASNSASISIDSDDRRNNSDSDSTPTRHASAPRKPDTTTASLYANLC